MQTRPKTRLARVHWLVRDLPLIVSLGAMGLLAVALMPILSL